MRTLIAMAFVPALAALGWATAIDGGSVSWWPAAALCWEILRARPPKAQVLQALFIVAATGATGVWFGVPLPLGMAEGVADVAGGLLVAQMTSPKVCPHSMAKEGRRWLRSLVAASASTLLVGALHVVLAHESWGAELFPRFMARLAGAATVGPFVRAVWGGFAWRRLLDRDALVVAALLTLIGAAARQAPVGSTELALVFVMVMPLLWAALRLEQPAPQFAILMVGLVGVMHSRMDNGVFSGPDGVPGLQAWLVVLSLTTLIAAAVTAERRVAFTELAQSERRFRLMSENGRDLVCVNDIDGVFSWVSASSTVISGWTPEELLGKNFHAFVHPDDASSVARVWEELIRNVTAPTARYRFRQKDGRYVWLETTAQFLEETQTVQSATRDITVRKRALERLRLACQSAGVVVFDWDLVSDRVVDDGRFVELLGVDLSSQPDVRAAYIRCVHPGDRRRLRREFIAAITGQQALRTRYRTLHPTKGERHVFASGEMEYDEAGRAVGMLGVNWDVTEQARAEEELRRARDASDAASQAKARYLAMMSHEIRTPLVGIIGLTEALSREVGLVHRPTVETIRRSGDALLAVLNDVLDLSKMEAGRLELEARLCDVEQLVGDVRSLYGRVAQAKGLAMTVQLDAGAMQLIADPLRLRQVLSNLVSNAVKFTAKGEVAVCARVAPPNERFPSGTLLLEVSDTGIGIPQQGLARLFQEFSQVDVGTSRRYGGTGLGLAISKRLVVAMGGTLSVSSVEGQGTTFTVRIPLTTAEKLAAARRVEREERVEVNAERLQGCRVLLAEDDAVNRRVAVGLLERLGCHVHAVENGRDAVETWRQGGWDVVVMDMQMPELDGLEATRLIREVEDQERLGPTPILAMTANTFAEDKEACLTAGMNDVVTKPATKSGLHAALVRLVEGRRHGPLRASA